MPADSFVAPKTNTGFDTYASEAVLLFRRPAPRPLACSSGYRQSFGQTPPLGQLEEVASIVGKAIAAADKAVPIARTAAAPR
jgi:hypothetical protein